MITKHRCANGVRIIVEKIPTVRSVAIGVWIGAGSRYETTETNGISHFLEHMFFKGTKTKNAREIAEAFDSIGGQVNAFTSKEYTCLYAKVLDEKAEYALDLLSDMFFNSVFQDEELKKERNVVLEEISMYEDTPDDIVHELLSVASFGEHPLAYSILGTESTLLEMDRSTLEAYKQELYTPENVVISVAGNASDSLIKAIEDHFGTYESESIKPILERPTIHHNKLTRKKKTEQSHLCLGFSGLPYGDERLYDLAVLNNLLGGSMSSRLFQEIREERGLAYSVFSYHTSFIDTGLLTIYAGTAPDQVDEVYETILTTLEDLHENGITAREIDNSKAQLKGNLMLSLESTNSRMSRNGKNELLLQTQRSLDDMIASIEGVTIETVNKLAEDLIDNEYSLSFIGPTNKTFTT